jgi:hypothetical protein
MKPSNLVVAVVRTLLCVWLALLASTSVRGEDAAIPATNAGGVTHISSKHAYFDYRKHYLISYDTVKLEDPRIAMTCEYLMARFPTNGSQQVELAIAETNVVAIISTNGTTYTIQAPKAVYTFQTTGSITNQTLLLTGTPEPTIWWQQDNSPTAKTNTFAAKRILWDLVNGNISAEENHGVFPDFQSGAKRPAPDSPAPATSNTTNATAAPKPANP